MSLTDRAIRNLKPRPKPRKVADGRGLFLLVQPSGSKLWRGKYRFQGKERLAALGRYPEVGIADARARWAEIRQAAAAGFDPAKLGRRGMTVDRLIAEWLEARQAGWAERTREGYLALVQRDINPVLGSLPLSSVSSVAVVDAVKQVEARGALRQATTALSIISQAFDFGVAAGYVTSNPTVGVRKALSSRQVKHREAPLEPATIGRILRQQDAYGGSLIVRCALKLLPLVVVRVSDLCGMKWSDVNLETREWRFTPMKTEVPHIVPLSAQALAIIEEIRPVSGRCEYVFPSTARPGNSMSRHTLLAALRGAGINKNELTLHGWRATFRTLADEVLHAAPHLIEHQLGHKVRDPLGRAYNRAEYLTERHTLMQAWSELLDNYRAA